MYIMWQPIVNTNHLFPTNNFIEKRRVGCDNKDKSLHSDVEFVLVTPEKDSIKQQPDSNDSQQSNAR